MDNFNLADRYEGNTLSTYRAMQKDAIKVLGNIIQDVKPTIKLESVIVDNPDTSWEDLNFESKDEYKTKGFFPAGKLCSIPVYEMAKFKELDTDKPDVEAIVKRITNECGNIIVPRLRNHMEKSKYGPLSRIAYKVSPTLEGNVDIFIMVPEQRPNSENTFFVDGKFTDSLRMEDGILVSPCGTSFTGENAEETTPYDPTPSSTPVDYSKDSKIFEATVPPSMETINDVIAPINTTDMLNRSEKAHNACLRTIIGNRSAFLRVNQFMVNDTSGFIARTIASRFAPIIEWGAYVDKDGLTYDKLRYPVILVFKNEKDAIRIARFECMKPSKYSNWVGTWKHLMFDLSDVFYFLDGTHNSQLMTPSIVKMHSEDKLDCNWEKFGFKRNKANSEMPIGLTDRAKKVYDIVKFIEDGAYPVNLPVINLEAPPAPPEAYPDYVKKDLASSIEKIKSVAVGIHEIHNFSSAPKSTIDNLNKDVEKPILATFSCVTKDKDKTVKTLQRFCDVITEESGVLKDILFELKSDDTLVLRGVLK